MRYAAITDPGLEPVTAEELEELVEADTHIYDTVVCFDTDEVSRVLHRAQSICRVVELGGYGSLDDVLDGEYSVEGSFRVSCRRVGEHDFTSQDVEQELGAVVHEQTGAPVDLEEPDTVIYCYVYQDKAYAGVNVTGKDLSRRRWKLYSHPASIRGNIAYALVHWSSWSGEQTLVDPCCGSAMIPIEAAIHALEKDPNSVDDPKGDTDASIYGFDDSAQALRYAEKNAQAARVDRHVTFSKKAVEWLDVTFEEDEIDALVTQPPAPSKRNEDVAELYDELLYQASYVVKGDVTLLLRDASVFKDVMGKHGFAIVDEREVRTGGLSYTVLRLEG